MHEGPVYGPALLLSGLPQHPDRAETSNKVKKTLLQLAATT